MTREEAIEIVKKHGILADGTKFELALRELIPELAESEDEKIYNEIMEFFKMNEKRCIVDNSYTKWIAWLEKQKDASKAIEAVERIDKYIDEYVQNAHDMKDSHPDKKYCQGIDDTLTGIAWILQDVYSEKENKFAPRVLPCSAAWFEDGDEKQQEQKPWKVGENAYFDPNADMWFIKKEQKPEWSESDKQNINLIISYLDSYIKEHNDTYGADECKSLKYWLKSLRPQPKRDCKDCAMFLNGKCTKPHWKPSEEQMKALQNAVALTACDKELARLYNQLKKL